MKTDYFGKDDGKRASERGVYSAHGTSTRASRQDSSATSTHITQIVPTNPSGARLNEMAPESPQLVRYRFSD